MPRRKDNLPSFNAVGAGQTATVDLPVDRRYHAVFINYKDNANQATIESDITEIRIKVDGKVQRRFSAKDLNAINAFNGFAFVAGMIPIFFSEPWRRNAGGEDTLAWGTYDRGTFQIEVDIAGAAVAPTLKGFYIFDNVVQPLQNIMKWRKQTVGITATGEQTVSNLSKRDIYHRIHCFETAANDIEAVSIELDGLQIYDVLDAENNALLGMQKFTPGANIFHIVFDETQRVEDGIPMVVVRNGQNVPVSEFRLDFEMGVANDFTMLIETRGNPD